jgi:hypothetical protein
MAEPETEAFELPATESAPAPVSYEHRERRMFGATEVRHPTEAQ